MRHSTSLPPGKRGVASVLFTLLGFITGALGMFGGLALLHAPVMRDEGMSSGGEISAEHILRDHLPPSVSDCPTGDIRGDSIAGSAYVSVICEDVPSATPSKVEYALFHDAIAVNDLFDAKVTSLGLEANASSGDCSRERPPPGWAPWYASGREMVQHLLGEGDPEHTAVSGGRMICYVDADGLYWIDWIDNDTHIYAFASATPENYQRLFQWWVRSAGPFHSHPVVGHPGMESATPMG
jgi:hypothetical protein